LSISNDHPRMQREARTIEAMIHFYCHDHHASQGGLCDGCDELLAYALLRLEKCPFQEGKTTCAKCPIHCYTPAMREQVRDVMRYAGPRMVFRHPILTLYHFLDRRREEPLSDPRRQRPRSRARD
jgi:hypothetical protein